MTPAIPKPLSLLAPTLLPDFMGHGLTGHGFNGARATRVGGNRHFGPNGGQNIENEFTEACKEPGNVL